MLKSEPRHGKWLINIIGPEWPDIVTIYGEASSSQHVKLKYLQPLGINLNESLYNYLVEYYAAIHDEDFKIDHVKT